MTTAGTNHRGSDLLWSMLNDVEGETVSIWSSIHWTFASYTMFTCLFCSCLTCFTLLVMSLLADKLNMCRTFTRGLSHTCFLYQSCIPLNTYVTPSIQLTPVCENTSLDRFCLCGSTWLIAFISVRGTYWPWTPRGQGQAGPSWSSGNGQSHWPCRPLDRRPWHADRRDCRPLSYVQLWRLHPARKLNIWYVLPLIHNQCFFCLSRFPYILPVFFLLFFFF